MSCNAILIPVRKATDMENWELAQSASDLDHRKLLIAGWEPFAADGGQVFFRRKAVPVRMLPTGPDPRFKPIETKQYARRTWRTWLSGKRG